MSALPPTGFLNFTGALYDASALAPPPVQYTRTSFRRGGPPRAPARRRAHALDEPPTTRMAVVMTSRRVSSSRGLRGRPPPVGGSMEPHPDPPNSRDRTSPARAALAHAVAQPQSAGRTPATRESPEIEVKHLLHEKTRPVLHHAERGARGTKTTSTSSRPRVGARGPETDPAAQAPGL